MKTVSVRIPDEWKKRMAKAAVAWSDLLRGAIEEELRRLEREEVMRRFLRSGKKSRSAAGAAVRSIREDRDGR